LSFVEFFHAMGRNPLLVSGLLAGGLASLACGLVGPFVVTRRIVFLSGAIAHIAVGGIGAAVFANHHWPAMFGWLEPIHGATVFALIGAMLIGVVHEYAAERTDTLIGAMWAVGMSVGILLIKYTPGYQTELMSYLFGNIATVDRPDVMRIAMLDVVIAGVLIMFGKRFLAQCLDPQFAMLQGVGRLTTNLVLLAIVALTVVTLVQIVGLILVIALLTLPAATAGHHLSRMGGIMVASVALSLGLTTLPRMAVYGTGVSPESAIVLAAGGVYLVSVVVVRVRERRGRGG